MTKKQRLLKLPPVLKHVNAFTGRERSPVLLYLDENEIKNLMRKAIDIREAKIRIPKGPSLVTVRFGDKHAIFPECPDCEPLEVCEPTIVGGRVIYRCVPINGENDDEGEVPLPHPPPQPCSLAVNRLPRPRQKVGFECVGRCSSSRQKCELVFRSPGPPFYWVEWSCACVAS